VSDSGSLNSNNGDHSVAPVVAFVPTVGCLDRRADSEPKVPNWVPPLEQVLASEH
jgi:hypothetical protein